jgi:hypothetical protein
MAKLDRTRPFGEVMGVMDDGTRYFQDDKRFDDDGQEIATAVVKRPRAKPVEDVVDPVSAEEFERQLKGV